MADELERIILADSLVSGKRTMRRGWFGKGKARKPLPFSRCENCGTELRGHWCYECGQGAVDYHRSFGYVILEVLDEFLNWDSKIFGTIGLLVVKPWRLTIDFVEGKRVRHAHPLRLYLVAGFIFFFVVNYSSRGIKIEPGKIPEKGKEAVAAEIEKNRDEIEKELEKENLSPEDRKKAQEFLNSLTKPSPSPAAPAPASVAPSPETSAPTAKVSPGESPAEPDKRTYGQINERPFLVFDDAKSTTPFEKWLEARAKDKMGEHGTKMGLFIATLFSNLPYMMLCCIPLFAFVLKVLYIRRRIFYIDHLIYALHIHTFFYTALMLIVFITIGLNRTIPGTFAGWIIAALWVTFVVQIFLSIRYVYRQGWFLSTLKFFVGGFIYFFVLILAFAATFFITLAIP
jgi:ribosomal protein L32